VAYTDLASPKVPLENFSQLMPVKAAGYTFQAPSAWGSRPAVGELQSIISEMIQQEADIAAAIAAWDGLTGDIIRTIRLVNAQFNTTQEIKDRNEAFIRSNGSSATSSRRSDGTVDIFEDLKERSPLPPVPGQSRFPAQESADRRTGDFARGCLAPVRGGLALPGWGLWAASGGPGHPARDLLAQEIAFDIAENEVNLANENASERRPSASC
jgi:hypothetical protein